MIKRCVEGNPPSFQLDIVYINLLKNGGKD